MFTTRSVLICSTAALLFAACGDDVTEVNENSYMAVLESGKKLSKQPCDSTRVGDKLFVVDSSATFVCDGEGWASLKGEKGDVGETGAQGEKGDKGATGAAGTGCTASELKASKDHANGGVKITCGDKSFELWNGEDGAVGKNGESAYELSGTELSLEKWLESLKGDKGETGESCTLADDGNGSVKIICGEKTATIYKALCGETPYDPAKKFCYEQELYDCDGEPYDPSKQFCHEQMLYDFCDGEPYDPSKQFCYEQKLYDFCDGKLYDPSKQYCLELTDGDGKKYQVEELLTDSRDGQIYRTVTIGNQVWMAENLNYAYMKVKFDNGTNTSDSISWCYNNESGNCDKYGRLYTWAAAIDSVALANDDDNPQICGYGKTCDALKVESLAANPIQGVCPSGWHLPSAAEWETLTVSVVGYGVAGTKLKSTSGWNDGGNGDDSFGFAILPAGSLFNGSFLKVGNYTQFWSSSESGDNGAYSWFFTNDADNVYDDDYAKDYAFSIRCVKN